MPLITIGLLQQQQAASAGYSIFPDLKGITKGAIYGDEFNRATLNPTNSIPIYTTDASNSGTAAMISKSLLRLTTDVNLNDHSKVTTQELAIRRVGVTPDTKIAMDFNFFVRSGNNITSAEYFFGVIGQGDTTDTLPGTAAHLGVQYNDSASNNWFLTSADGTDQTTTDTGLAVAVAPQEVRLNILWTGDNSATLRLFDGDIFDNEVASQTVTAFGEGQVILKAIVITETTAAKRVDFSQWNVQAS